MEAGHTFKDEHKCTHSTTHQFWGSNFAKLPHGCGNYKFYVQSVHFDLRKGPYRWHRYRKHGRLHKNVTLIMMHWKMIVDLFGGSTIDGQESMSWWQPQQKSISMISLHHERQLMNLILCHQQIGFHFKGHVQRPPGFYSVLFWMISAISEAV